jgi:hypothetical protein
MNQKRKTLQKIVGIGAVATVVPSSWIKPVVSSVVLPAHAQTSSLTPIVTVIVTGTPTVSQTIDETSAQIVGSTGAFDGSS